MGTPWVPNVYLRLCLSAQQLNHLRKRFSSLEWRYRKQELGRKLFELAKTCAQEKGAKRLYVSATPSENTVNFYMRQGCRVTKEPDPELFELEPEDIHLEMEI